MTSLIPIVSGELAGEVVQAVNARDLHSFLEVETKFADWVVRRIDEYGFVENQDYVRTLLKIGKRSNVTQIDYHLSLDMAKELAMVERNDRGRQARRYFIECERRAWAAAGGAFPGQARPAGAVELNARKQTFQVPAHDHALPAGAVELVDAFLAERTRPDRGGRIQAGVLYAAFAQWCRDRGQVHVPSSIAFGRIARRKFHRQTSRVHWWLDVSLLPAVRESRPDPARPRYDAGFALDVGRLSGEFYDVWRDALMRCDEIYRRHGHLLRSRFPHIDRDHDLAELLRQAEGSGRVMINAAADALGAAANQMRAAERVYRLGSRGAEI